MKYIIKPIFVITSILLALGCAKEIGDFTVQGEAIDSYSLTYPENNAIYMINPATPDKVLEFSWQSAASGLGSSVSFTMMIDAPDGSFENPIHIQAADNSGAANTVSVAYGDIMDAVDQLKQSGDTIVTLYWNTKAENGSANIANAREPFYLNILLTDGGVSAFEPLNPADGQILMLDGSLPDDNVSFSWSKSMSTNQEDTVKYTFYIDELGGDFSDPMLMLKSDNMGVDTSITYTNQEWYDMMKEALISEGSYQWAVRASTEDFNLLSKSHDVYIQPKYFEFVYHIVGDATEPGWDIDNAIPLTYVAPNMNIGYIRLKTGGYKFFPEIGSWDNGLGASDVEGELGEPNNNITSPNTSEDFKLYRITITFDKETNKYYHTCIPAEMVLVGDATPAGWNIDGGYHMYYKGNNDFVGYANFVDGGFKFFVETGNWNSGYGQGDEGLAFDPGAGNITSPGTGYYRVYMDMANLTWTSEVAEESMYVVGSATPGEWDIASSTPMTKGATEGLWEVDIDLTANGELKFVPLQDWANAFGLKDGEISADPSAGNMPGPTTAGNYHVTIDLWNKTYSIVAN